MEEMKRCPQCGQMVRLVAKKCRYCGYWFEEPANDNPPKTEQPHVEEPPKAEQPRVEEPPRAESTRNYDNQGGGVPPSEPTDNYEGRLITVSGVLSEGFSIGMKNFLSIFVAYILFILTCWIPYINVGTTIGLVNLPIVLSKNKDSMISPTFIFDGKYRKYMGEFFSLAGLMLISIIPAFFFMIVPAIIIGYGWSQAYYLMFDKEISPSESMIKSTKITYGYKSTLFWIDLIIAIASGIAISIFTLLTGLLFNSSFVNMLVTLLLSAVVGVIRVGCSAVSYRELQKRL